MKAVLVAALIGSVTLFVIANSGDLFNTDTSMSGLKSTLGVGAIVGASVQLGVRLIGVS
jgi:hypothetical protein